MGSALLITLREGLEAALIVAIVLAYLKRLDREADFRSVWLGTAGAVAVSVAAGVLVFVGLGELEGSAEQITEGLVAFAAAGVLTWMIFWMARQARLIKGKLEARVDAALVVGSGAALASIAFVSVLREGLETSLFLLSTSVGEESSAGQFLGGLIGLTIAGGIAYGIYRGSRRVNLRVFFRATGILIILFAAGLLAKGVQEFQEAGLLGSLRGHVWDVSRVTALNPDTSGIGEFLKGLLGWSPNPSLEMVVVYLAFLLPASVAFVLRTRRVPIAPRTGVAEAPARAA